MGRYLFINSTTRVSTSYTDWARWVGTYKCIPEYQPVTNLARWVGTYVFIYNSTTRVLINYWHSLMGTKYIVGGTYICLPTSCWHNYSVHTDTCRLVLFCGNFCRIIWIYGGSIFVNLLEISYPQMNIPTKLWNLSFLYYMYSTCPTESMKLWSH